MSGPKEYVPCEETDAYYLEAARIERHRLAERPDPNTGYFDDDVLDAFWADEELEENENDD